MFPVFKFSAILMPRYLNYWQGKVFSYFLLTLLLSMFKGNCFSFLNMQRNFMSIEPIKQVLQVSVNKFVMFLMELVKYKRIVSRVK